MHLTTVWDTVRPRIARGDGREAAVQTAPRTGSRQDRHVDVAGVRAVFVRSVRPPLSRLATLQDATESSQIAGSWRNRSDFALMPTIPGLCSRKRRRESPKDARIGSPSEPRARRYEAGQPPRFAMRLSPRRSATSRSRLRLAAKSMTRRRREPAQQPAFAQFLQPRLPGLGRGAQPLEEGGH
jgi:hypothetical protein